MQGPASAALRCCKALRLMGAYQTFVFCQKNSDTSVDLADRERDEHCVWYVIDMVWRCNVYGKLSSLVPDYCVARASVVSIVDSSCYTTLHTAHAMSQLSDNIHQYMLELTSSISSRHSNPKQYGGPFPASISCKTTLVFLPV
jgi:hypothetical protein